MQRTIYLLLLFIIQPFSVMLLLGAVHHDVNTNVPALGYVDTFLVVWLFNSLVGTTIIGAIVQGMHQHENMSK